MKRSQFIGWVVGAALLVAPAGVQAAVSIYLSPEELSARAPLIVEARVTASRAGVDPANGSLHTYVTLDVETTLRGATEAAELVLREPGGAWGDVVHQVDAVPVYRPGERVFVYLEPASDGSLRTVGMFFGKFTLRDDLEDGPLLATRDLEGQGTILGAPARDETLPHADLAALAASVQPRDAGRAWIARPPEWERLAWSPAELTTTSSGTSTGTGGVDVALNPGGATSPAFVALSTSNPARWTQADGGQAVTVHVEPAGNPLADDAAAAAEIGRALTAWTAVPQSRLTLTLGNTNYDFTGSHNSPASNYYNGVNVVLFDDPYDDISDPSGCGGVLAIGGYWRSGSTGEPVNGVTFHPALSMYVIFSNAFECFLGNPDNLAEVAAHEIGHGIGFGHSWAGDAIMRPSAYGYRGPRLGNDDIDAAHCHYPHTLELTRPVGGETWTAGAVETIEWTATAEAGGDPGTVDLEYSIDGGSSWIPIAAGTSNDGGHAWTVPETPGGTLRIRVLRPALDAVPETYPVEACSGDASAAFAVSSAAPVAGSLGAGLRLAKLGGSVRLSWEPSCSGDVETYAVYEGSLDALRAGSWDHAPRSCDAGLDATEDLTPGGGLRYYLVAARAGALEGSLGSGAGGTRPAPGAACAPREADSTCEP